MTIKIFILILSAAIAVLLNISKQNKVNWPITYGLTIGILLGLTSMEYFDTIGLIVFAVSSFIGFVYAFRLKGAKTIEAITIGLASFLTTLHCIFSVFQWPNANELRLIMIIPVCLYLFLLFRSKTVFQRKYSFLTILFTYSIIQFSKIF